MVIRKRGKREDLWRGVMVVAGSFEVQMGSEQRVLSILLHHGRPPGPWTAVLNQSTGDEPGR
jgi:hypothetical protein